MMPPPDASGSMMPLPDVSVPVGLGMECAFPYTPDAGLPAECPPETPFCDEYRGCVQCFFDDHCRPAEDCVPPGVCVPRHR